MKVFKYNKIRIVDGKKVKTPSKSYYGKLKDSNGTWRRVCLFADKASSLFELQKRARQAQQVQAGMIEADTSSGLETPLDEHLERYAEAVKERSQKSASTWCDEKKVKVEKILHQAGVLMPKDVTTAKIKDALGKLAKKNEWSKRTSNQYLIAIKGFFSWMVLENRLPFNPVLTLKAQAVKDADCRRLRRTFTQDEAGALVQFLYASKDQRKVSNPPKMRALLYALAFQTGLRAKELMSIAPSNFDLEKAEIAIHGRETKNGVSEVIPLPKVLVSMVAAVLAERKNTTNLFKGVYHRGQLFEEAVAGDYLIMVVKEASGSDRVKMIGHERRLLRVVVVDGPVLMVIELILECGVMQLVVQVRVHPQLVDDILMNPSTA